MPAPGPERFNLARHCLGRQAAERGGKTARVIADGPEALRCWTYAELDGMVRRLAGGLIQGGLGKGDRVMIRAANDIDFLLAFFAVTGIGCVAQPASLMLTAEEALTLAADSGASAIFLRSTLPNFARLFSDGGPIVRSAATRRGFRKDRRVRGGAGVHGATDSGLTRCRIDSRPGCEQAGAWSPFRPFRPCSCAEQGNNLPCYFCSPRPIFHRRLYRNPLGRNLFPDRRGRGERTLRPCSLRDNRVKQGTIP